MELSKRLQAVADLVAAGHITVDIGTDHAYIPIYLIEKGFIPSAVAMDINEGPLMRAKNHVEEAGLLNQIDLRLSNGLEKLHQGEAWTAVIAGMGGGLMCQILKDNWEITLSLHECILQPQSEIAKVRAFLLKEGFLFIQENMVYEEGKFYPMMKVRVHGSDPKAKEPVDAWSETEIRYGKLLLDEKNPILKQFLEREYTLKSKIMKRLKEQGGEKAKIRIRELEEEIEYINKGRMYYAV